jgi:hypothetical protein
VKSTDGDVVCLDLGDEWLGDDATSKNLDEIACGVVHERFVG